MGEAEAESCYIIITLSKQYKKEKFDNLQYHLKPEHDKKSRYHVEKNYGYVGSV